MALSKVDAISQRGGLIGAPYDGFAPISPPSRPPEGSCSTNSLQLGHLEVGLDGKLGDFRNGLREVIRLPPERLNRPRHDLVEKANVLRGWQF